MAKYIDKFALVAEIERKISEYEKCGRDNTSVNAKIIALQSLLIYIDTLETKEVSLEEERLTWKDIGTIDQLLWDLSGEHSGKSDNEGYYKAVLSSFKAQKGE